MKKYSLFYKVIALLLAVSLLTPSSPISIFTAHAVQNEESSTEPGSAMDAVDEEAADGEEADPEETASEETVSEEADSEEADSEEAVLGEENPDGEEDPDGTVSGNDVPSEDGGDEDPIEVTSGDMELTDTGTQWSVALDNDRYMYGDKYVAAAEGLVTQNNFQLMMEAGFEDPRAIFTKMDPPEGINVALLIDQSDHMFRNGNNASLNGGLESYFGAIKAENQKRMSYAREGLYTGIDPDNAEEEMQDHLVKVILTMGYSQESAVRYKNVDGLAVLSDADVRLMLSSTQVTSLGNNPGTGAILDGNGYYDARIGTAMEHMEDEIAQLPEKVKGNMFLAVFSVFDYIDNKMSSTYAAWADSKGHSGGQREWSKLALFANTYLFAPPEMGTVKYASEGYKNFCHYHCSMNQANWYLDAARRIKADGVKIQTCAVNMDSQVDMVEAAVRSGNLAMLDTYWYAGILTTMASLSSSDYPVNSHFGVVWSWIADTYSGRPTSPGGPTRTVVRNASFDDYPGFNVPTDFVDSGLFGFPSDFLERIAYDYDTPWGCDYLYYDFKRSADEDYPLGDERRFRGVCWDYKDGYSPNKLGVYTYLPEDADEMIAASRSIAVQQTGMSSDSGYASSTAVLQDELSDVFRLTDGRSSVKVYKVPRVPLEYDEDGNPTAFGWGQEFVENEDESISTDWVDITDQVSINITGKRISISGFSYEMNALTNANKFGRSPYKPGDFGWKLVARLDITAEDTFGGNGIRTNNPDVSGFIPSEPGTDAGLPSWKDNEELNPDGSEFVAMHPLPYVALMPTNPYALVYDDVIVYAPQTAPLHNLVMTDNGDIFYNDPLYDMYKAQLELLEDEYEAIIDKMVAANEYLYGGPDTTPGMPLDKLLPGADEDDEDLKDKLTELYNGLSEQAQDKKKEVNDTRALMSECIVCVPDGKNNQFVDIRYTLTDPDGMAVGSIFIPRGKAYVDGNIEWNFNVDNTIVKSGTYHLAAEITPVASEGSPDGYIYTDADIANLPESQKNALIGVPGGYMYHSESYSSTGSVAKGEFTGTVAEADPSAYLFTLVVFARGTRLMPRQTVDVILGSEPLMMTENPHIADFDWMCTDGVTQSLPENEPGTTTDLTVGMGGVDIATVIPDRAFTDGKAQMINSITATGDESGDYVPVTTTLRRQCGTLDKKIPLSERVKQTTVYMSDSDCKMGLSSPDAGVMAMAEGDGGIEAFAGSGTVMSSVVWIHECVEVENCQETTFRESQVYGDSDDGLGEFGMVRYLIHVEDNPKPEIHKSTQTPIISEGDPLPWTVTISNDSETFNPNQLANDFSLVDVIPWNGDTRIDPMTNEEGSDFHGSLLLTGVSFDMSGSPTTLERLEGGLAKIYATSDTNVRTADEAQILGQHDSGNIEWTEMEFSIVDSNVSVMNLPKNCQAIRLDGRLKWGESLSMNITAQVSDMNLIEGGDRYFNEAWVYNGNGGNNSETSAIRVDSGFIDGFLWEDANNNGTMEASEKKLSGIPVTLYKEWDPNNGTAPDRVVGGVKLSYVYDKGFDKIPSYVTGDNGHYVFENLQPGTYWVVADTLAKQYSPTAKQAGKGDEGLSKTDSECEETFSSNTDKDLDNTAYIKSIELTGGVSNMNMGMRLLRGSIKVTKNLNEIYYPSSLSGEDQEDYQLVFLFKLKNTATGEVFKKTVRIDGKNLNKPDSRSSCVFSDLPLGTYELTEMDEAQYNLESFTSTSPACVYNRSTKTMTITLTPDEYDFKVTANNVIDREPPGGDENGLRNWVNVRVPVALDVVYVGDDPITGKTITKYAFQASDFDPAKGGDMVVTYDDGTQASLSDGTLRFEDVTLSPDTVTNMMNTSGHNRMTISAYYTEKGRTVKDTFRVGVDLKPVHKFQLNFDANGSTFANGSTRNVVHFAYDENAGCNVVTSGSYKDVPNGGLIRYKNDMAYGFAGWNTKYDGSGINYDNLSALDAIGRDPTISSLTLYAQWTVTITFNTQGGTCQPQSGLTVNNLTPGERAVVGQGIGKVTYNLNQMMTTGLMGSKTNYHFVLWNTAADGGSTDLTSYGRITGPETFYAVYYQSDYYYTGAPQTFTAPVDGWYRFTLYGADGGYGNNRLATAGYGGKVAGTIWLKRGQGFYVYVGQTAPNTVSHLWTWNGGAPSPRGFDIDHWGGAGGGATDIRLVGGAWNDIAGLKSRIAVAGGGGGAGSTCSLGMYPNGTHFAAPNGGNAGGLVAETIYAYHTFTGNVNGITTGATQTSGGRGTGGLDRGDTSSRSDCQGGFGIGATGATCCSGGGGGWYGGATCYTTGGSGGSSYLLGWPGCDTTYAAYQRSLAGYDLTFKDAVFLGGGQWNRNEKTWGESGGAAFLTLIQRTY